VHHAAYNVLLMNFFCFFMNFFCMCAYASGGQNTEPVNAIFLSLCFIVMGMPGAFYIWYRVLYIACVARKASYYFICMCTLMCSCLFWAAHCAGIPGTGQAGVILMINQFDKASDYGGGSYLVGAIMQIILLVVLVPNTVFSFYLWGKVRQLYNASGGDEAAKGQAAQMAAENETIRNAAVSGAMAGAQAQAAKK